MQDDQVLFKAAQIVMALTGHGPQFRHRLAVAFTLCNRARYLVVHDGPLKDQFNLAWPAAVDDAFNGINTDPKLRDDIKHTLRQTLAECHFLRDSMAAICAASYGYEPDPTGGAVLAHRKGCVLPISGLLAQTGNPKLTIVKQDEFFDYYSPHRVMVL